MIQLVNMNGKNEKVFRPKRLSPEEIQKGCEYLNDGDPTETRLCVISEEFRQGLYFIKKYKKSVTFFGSARLKPHEEAYKAAQSLAKKVVVETGYAIVTGGGPGIMSAGALGAYDGGGRAVGLTIHLPMEQTTSPWLTDQAEFMHFYSRKVTLAYGSESYVFFTGGYGTMDELFEVLTLKQTGKIGAVPIILVGTEFWTPLYKYFEELANKYGTIDKADLDLITITDDEDEIIEIIKNAPVRSEGEEE